MADPMDVHELTPREFKALEGADVFLDVEGVLRADLSSRTKRLGDSVEAKQEQDRLRTTDEGVLYSDV